MKKITTKDLRQFGLVLGLILCVVAFLHFRKQNLGLSYWLAFFGGTAALFSVLGPECLRPVYRVFIKVAHAIGWVNTRVILVIVYYVILTPIGIIMKVFRRDLLNAKIDKNAMSYWIKRKETHSII